MPERHQQSNSRNQEENNAPGRNPFWAKATTRLVKDFSVQIAAEPDHTTGGDDGPDIPTQTLNPAKRDCERLSGRDVDAVASDILRRTNKRQDPEQR